MKLEFLEDLTDNGKYKDVVSENLIRLYDFNSKEVNQFQSLIQRLINKSISEIDLENQDFIEAINCQLKLVIHKDNNGINKVAENSFICKMNKESYQHIEHLIEPFTKRLEGYQWLDELCSDSEIDFLFSVGGSW